MEIKDILQEHAYTEFTKCCNKYQNKIWNMLHGIIYHAFNEGKKEGEKAYKKKLKEKIEGESNPWSDDPIIIQQTAYNQGLRDMLEAIRDIYFFDICPSSGTYGCKDDFTPEELKEAFKGHYLDSIYEYNAQEIMSALKSIKKKREEKKKIVIGDELRDDTGKTFVCTCIDETYIEGISQDGTTHYYELYPDEIGYPTKTGKHYDIKSIIGKIYGGEEY